MNAEALKEFRTLSRQDKKNWYYWRSMQVVKFGKSTSWEKLHFFVNTMSEESSKWKADKRTFKEKKGRMERDSVVSTVITAIVFLLSYLFLPIDTSTLVTLPDRLSLTIPCLFVSSLSIVMGIVAVGSVRGNSNAIWPGVREIGTSRGCSKPHPPKHNGAVLIAYDGNACIDCILRGKFYESYSNSLWDLSDR